MTFLLTAAVAILGGLGINLAFPSPNWWWAAPIALAMLMAVTRSGSSRRGAFLGFLWGAGFFSILLSWALVSVPGTWLPWAALCVAEAAFIAIFGALAPRLRGRGFVRAVQVAVLWTGIEQVRMAAPFGGLPWGALAFSQTDGPLVHLAPWGGTVTVGFVVALIAALLAETVSMVEMAVVQRVALPVTAVAIVVGSIFVPLLPATAETGTITVGLVQASVPERGAAWWSQGAAITTSYRKLTEALIAESGPVDVVLWPESAADISPRTDPNVSADIEAAALAAGVPILFGTQEYPDDGYRYNQYVVWTSEGIESFYEKQHPVPFGEYIPLRSFIRNFTSAVDRVGVDMAAGTEPGILDVTTPNQAVRFGVGICFEVAYDGIIREGVNLGAEAIVIPTNNASFGFTQEAFQQAAMTRFRAIEFSRTAIQIATTGVSVAYGPDGETLAASPDTLYEQWTRTAHIPLRTTLTPSARMGDWPRLVLWALTGLVVVSSLIRKEPK